MSRVSQDNFVTSASCSDHTTQAIFPVSRQTWDEEYNGGQWSYLRRLSEMPRYALITGFLWHRQANRRVLDVGCGEGILLQYLRPYGYEQYVGIDVSKVAVRGLAPHLNDKTHCIVANAESWQPVTTFDAIVFNECLYYFASPISAFERYRSCLGENGILITSLFLSNRGVADLASQLMRKFRCLQSVKISNGQGIWITNLFVND